jgi:hypothetical protein
MCIDHKIITQSMKSVTEFIFEMKEENDRAAVIVGAANVDTLLRKLLEQSLLPPKDRNKDEFLGGDSPLSTFSSKINLCYRLVLIDKEFCRLLHILRKIRNDFAHKIKGCDLNSPPHSDQVNELVKHLKNDPLFEKLRGYFTGDKPISRDFRIMLSLISALLEVKLRQLPKTVRSNPVSISWIPKDVEV